MYYKCCPGNMPEDFYPELFSPNYKGRSHLVCRIGNSEDDFGNISMRELRRKHLVAPRTQSKNGKRYTWCGEHPLFWSLL